ncbi:zinc ion binding / nucleic acid binding protein, partial [Thalictrum thalictroides]
MGVDGNPVLSSSLQIAQEVVDREIAVVIDSQVAEKFLEEEEVERDFIKRKIIAPQEKQSADLSKQGPQSTFVWANLFRSDKGESFNVDLYQYEPCYENGVAKCPIDILEKGDKEWKEYIVGFFMGRRLPYPMVKEALKKQWKVKGNYEIATDEDFFYFKFSNDEDRRVVMDQGPVFIAGRIFILKPWNNSIESQRRQFRSIPLWVNVHGVPKNLWTKEGLSYIGSLLGKPICTDEATIKKTRLTFARICVEVESIASLPVSKKVDISEEEPVTLTFDYPWKPQQCAKCNEFGHTEKRCGELREPTKFRYQAGPQRRGNPRRKDEWRVVI